jgi:ABC-type amino acid transport substrate-binding protein
MNSMLSGRTCLLALLFALQSTSALCAAPAINTVPVAPWTFPKEPTRGIAPEYLRYLFNSAHIDVAFGTLPYGRVINGLRDGSNLAAVLIPDAERDAFALRLCTVTSIRSGILYKKSRFAQLSLDRLAGLTIGEQRGTHALDKMSTTGANMHTIDSIEQGLKMLVLDRVDATFVSSPGSEIVLVDNGLAPKEYGWLEVDVAPVVVYISRKTPLAADTAALARLRSVCEGSGQAVMKALMLKYR